MAEKEKKNEKGKEPEKEAEKEDSGKEKRDGKAESPIKAGGRSKRIIILGLVGIFLAAGSVGGFFVYKTLSKKATDVSIQATEGEKAAPAADGHGAKDSAENGEKAKDAHGAPAAAADGKTAEGHANAPTEAAAAATTTKNAETQLFQISKMEVNVGSEIDRGYVRIAVAIQYEGDADQEAELKKNLPILQDIIITEIGKRKRADLLRDTGKRQLRNDLVHEFQRRLSRPIKEVFLTDFLVE
jgi:flagellar basal body-associated protein FliL